MSNQQYTATGYPAPSAASHAAGGYPYAAPPPHPTHYANNANPNPNPNAFYYSAPYGTAQRATYYRRFMVAVVSILIIFATVLFIIWLVLRPRVPQFRMDSLSLSQFNVSSSSSVSGNWTASFTVYNPNSKMHVYYDDLDGGVYYRSELLATNRLPPFDQATKSSRNMSATFVATTAYVDGWVASGINGDRGHGSVKFNLKIVATVHFKAGGWWTRRRFLRVFCDDLPVGISSNSAIGSLTGGPQNCAVGV